jgi:hypothetical protein
MGQSSNGERGAYDQLLMDARIKGEVGVYKHMKRPTEPTSRLGFRGKKVKKSDLKLIAVKMAEAAKHNPSLKLAADNIASRVESIKAQERAKQKKTPERVISVEEARELLRQIEAQQPKPQPKAEQPTKPQTKAEQPKAVQQKPVEAAKPQPPPLNEFELRKRLLAEQKAKLANSLKVEQFGRNVYLKCKNVVE